MSDPKTITKTNLITALEQSDEMRRSARADRIIWLSDHQISLGVVSGPMDTMSVLGEARDCFVEGHYIAALLMAVIFIEHTIAERILASDLNKKPRLQFGEAIKIAVRNDLFESDLLDGAERLRVIRNPFAHRNPDDEHSFGSRFLEQRVHPQSILEQDAKDALAVMYRFFHASLTANEP